MKIVACGPPSQDKPYVPTHALSEDGQAVGPVEITERLAAPLDLPDESWFAVMPDGSTEAFPKASESAWRAKHASLLVQKAAGAQGDPLGRLSMLRAAANLIGLSLPALLACIGGMSKPGETLESAFLKLREQTSSGK